jgi:hypothetical protein
MLGRYRITSGSSLDTDGAGTDGAIPNPFYRQQGVKRELTLVLIAGKLLSNSCVSSSEMLERMKTEDIPCSFPKNDVSP